LKTAASFAYALKRSGANTGCQTAMNQKNDLSAVPVFILCGGLGTRIKEETEFRPKPMVPIGEHPILWHVMQI
jgi:molybdopterin-guanine dinucleotide biosynthesis protein A